MYTPGLECSVVQKVDNNAYHPSLEKAAVGEQSYVQGLELYTTDQDKYPRENFQSRWPGLPRDSASANHVSYESQKKQIQPSQSKLNRKAKLWLIGIFVMVILVIVIATSIAGSLAVRKRGNDNQKTAAFTAVASPSNTSSPTVVSGATVSTPSSPVPKPSSDCSTLNTTFAVLANPARAVEADVKFDIKCGHDYKLPLVMAMHTINFEDCIKACASHATNTKDASTRCVVAVYKPDSGQPLTCWLKSTGDVDAEIASIGVDSAQIYQG